MSCWRVLPQSLQAANDNVPPLLVKPVFTAQSYTVYLTDLSNIWSEELGEAGVLERASQQDSPIEVSAQDSAQLVILLEHVQQSLVGGKGPGCVVTKADDHDIVLHTTTKLPGPLGTLKWEFNMKKRTSATLKNELILPLLVSSHIQHERINGLLAIVQEKDKALTRLVDQFESSNLDLVQAFPSLATMKAGRRALKREQAARHVPGLQPFHEEDWMKETELLRGHRGFSSLDLFQEALSQCNPTVPLAMKTQPTDTTWWTSIPKTLHSPLPAKKQNQTKASPPRKPPSEIDDDETEDEFETHENFKRREAERTTAKAKELPPVTKRPLAIAIDDDTETDDDDLDAPAPVKTPAKASVQATSQMPVKAVKVQSEDGTETDDEDLDAPFTARSQKQSQNHAPVRSAVKPPPKTPVKAPVRAPIKSQSDDDTETDDDDLDAPFTARSQKQSQNHSLNPSQKQIQHSPTRAKRKSSTPPRSPSPAAATPAPKKRAGFKIGGARAKKAEETLDEDMPDASETTPPKPKRSFKIGGARAKKAEIVDEEMPDASETTPQKPKRSFKIGGKKNNASQQSRDGMPTESTPPAVDEDAPDIANEKEAPQTVDKGADNVQPTASTPEEKREETSDEKAARRREELKRRNDELARQAARKKKRRF